MTNDISNRDGPEYPVSSDRLNRAVKNARKLCVSPVISENSGVTSIHIDSAALNRLSAKCSTKELEMFKLLVSGYNQCEVAQQLGISQSNVSRKITKLKKILSEK